MNNLENILRKIKSLLAKASDVSSPKEAVIAANMARKMMDKYHVSHSVLFEHDPLVDLRYGVNYKRTEYWKEWLFSAIADWNDCILGIHKSFDKSMYYIFKGFKTDVDVCMYMADYLSERAVALCKKHNFATRGEINQYKQSFSLFVCKRINSLITVRRKYFADGKQLVVVRKQLVEARFGMAKYKSASFKDPNDDQMQAFYQGAYDGSKVGLNPHLPA